MTRVKIQRLPNDPLCTRVSIGGNEETGFYCVYRGTREAAILCIKVALTTLQRIPEQEIEDEYRISKN